MAKSVSSYRLVRLGQASSNTKGPYGPIFEVANSTPLRNP